MSTSSHSNERRRPRVAGNKELVDNTNSTSDGGLSTRQIANILANLKETLLTTKDIHLRNGTIDSDVLDDLSLDESEELVFPDSTSCESDTDDSDIEGNDSSTISSGSNRRRKQKKKHGEKSEKNGKSLNPLLREYIDHTKTIIKKKSDDLRWCHPPDVYSCEDYTDNPVTTI
ncbi:hypothetical protein V1521DRAFT_458092 [Lipomyces starkeyi]